MTAAFSPSIQTPNWLVLGMRLKLPLVRFAALIAVALTLLPLSQAQAGEPQASTLQGYAAEHATVAQRVDAQTPVFPAAGRYLFGQVPQPDQLGQGYMVFENDGEQVFGALYYPSSSFDCFRGTIQAGQLAMTITNSYTQETYPYSIALVSDTSVAAPSPDSLEPLSLEGFYQIDEVDENDLRMLETCRAVNSPQT